MNVNYVGSLAERKLNFTSSVSVENLSQSDIFNSVSIYIPLSLAVMGIVGFDSGSVGVNSPALLAVTLDNYATELQGDLLAQVLPMFAGGTNAELTLFLIVFWDTDTTPTSWALGASSISFAPLTEAFQALYFLSYIKMLYDPSYDGTLVTIEGSPSLLTMTLTNGSGVSVSIAPGSYVVTAAGLNFGITIDETTVIPAAGTLVGVIGVDSVNGTTTATTATVPSLVGSGLPAGVTAAVTAVTQGVANSTRASTYFKLALAMADLALANVELSAFWANVHLDFSKIDLNTGIDTNACQIRASSVAQEIAAIPSIATGNLSAHFWGALNLMGALNTFVAVDCENVGNRNLLSIVIGAWFGGKNASGQYVGNKLSLLRLLAQNCFGPASQINGAFNAGDSDGYDTFDSKNVGCLVPISGSNNGDSYLSMCRGVTGIPIGALMISKYVDYMSAQECADMITDTGTLANPVLTNEEAYTKIQNIVLNLVISFVGTGRISQVKSLFPSFKSAKSGRTAITAASSWKATYVDDLDTVDISGAIVAA